MKSDYTPIQLIELVMVDSVCCGLLLSVMVCFINYCFPYCVSAIFHFSLFTLH